MRHVPLGIAAASLALVVGIALTGCSAGSFTFDSGSSGASDQATAEAEPTSSPSPSTSAPVPQASIAPGSVALPSTFPKAVVPLIDGKIVFAIDLGTGWTVVFAYPDFQTGHTKAVAQLKVAGFTVVSDSPTAAGSFTSLTGNGYQVNLTSVENPSLGPSVSYTVVKQG